MENIPNNIFYLLVGIGTLAFLRKSDWKEEGSIVGYVIVLAFSSLAWMALLTGTGDTGLIGIINFVILGVVMVILHFVLQKLND